MSLIEHGISSPEVDPHIVPPHGLIPDMLSRFTPETLHMQCCGEIDPSFLHYFLHGSEGRMVLATDIGGSSIRTQMMVINRGSLRQILSCETDKEENGQNYVEHLKKIAEVAHKCGMPMGVATPGFLKGPRQDMIEAVNLSGFSEATRDHGGLRRMLGMDGNLSVINDARAGLIGAMTLIQPEKNIFHLTIGTGIGTAYGQREPKNKNGMAPQYKIYTAEGGQIPVIPALNPCGTNEEIPCEKFGTIRGIQSILAAHGVAMKPKEIAQAASDGDQKVTPYVQNAEYIVGHIIAGVIQAGNLDPAETLLVASGGGATKINGFIEQAVKRSGIANLEYVVLGNEQPNPNLNGAGITALMNQYT